MSSDEGEEEEEEEEGEGRFATFSGEAEDFSVSGSAAGTAPVCLGSPVKYYF